MTHPYLPLANPANRPSTASRTPIIILGFSLILNVLLIFTFYTGKPWNTTPSFLESSVVYSPAHDAVSYQAQSFDRGFQSAMPIYEQDPSEEVDAAWKELTRYTVSKITKAEAQQMANHTYPLVHKEGYYMSGLDVFHQLHCLDMLRMSLYPEYYPSMAVHSTHLHRAHMAHCVGHVRQALMCNADITPIVWQWEEDAQLVRRKDDVPHTCKSFERIHQWAKERFEYVDDEDMKVFVSDDL
ncbi:hypothetical protein CPB85DRAFT_571732 [Mucidula mucida]|nr:hypothetical protein CPB85DRAFT_571732 [Mucidula mucida]